MQLTSDARENYPLGSWRPRYSNPRLGLKSQRKNTDGANMTAGPFRHAISLADDQGVISFFCQKQTKRHSLFANPILPVTTECFQVPIQSLTRTKADQHEPPTAKYLAEKDDFKICSWHRSEGTEKVACKPCVFDSGILAGDDQAGARAQNMTTAGRTSTTEQGGRQEFRRVWLVEAVVKWQQRHVP